ncbi:MAG TPA: nicotinate-nucleotide adenylyltransferase [Candidatus Eremiobacteraceae bacterium]
MRATRRIGILGGAFDPVHNGHLAIARGVIDEARLDRVLFMPVGAPAHRATHAPAADRAEMVRLALESEDPRLQFDATALDQPGPAYTADTLILARRAYPDDALFFIAGADSLGFSKWRRLDEVAAAVERFYVVSRRGSSWTDVEKVIGELGPPLRERFVPIDITVPEISASEIRARVASGKSIGGLVPDEVARYIKRAGLYK